MVWKRYDENLDNALTDLALDEWMPLLKLKR
jgi:hypothetical protein